MLGALHRLPLADPLSDSLGRLNGQYPALTYVDRAYNVRMPLVAALLATEPIPRGSVVGVRMAAVGIWAAQRSIRGWGEFHPTTGMPVCVACHVHPLRVGWRAPKPRPFGTPHA